MSYRHRSLALLAMLLLPSLVFACMWDYDTLRQERSRFPSVLELITGKFPRHSREFYQWRIHDREQRLRASPDNLDYTDDLAVAYDKCGQHKRAIAIMSATGKKQPGRYETEANLGTFDIHAGQFEAGLKHIDETLRINPQAHFGRERYQRWLVMYMLKRRPQGKIVLPLAREREAGVGVTFSKTFADYLREQYGDRPFEKQDREQAITGVLGMMRFGNYDSPVLLEALGSLLSQGKEPQWDAKRLAARAYLKASYAVADSGAQKNYRQMAAAALVLQTRHPYTMDPLQLKEMEATFKKELAEARAWYKGVEHDEHTWIRDGKDPETEFSAKYYGEPQILFQEAEPPPPWYATTSTYLRIARNIGIGSMLCLVGVALCVVAVRFWHKAATRSRAE